MAAWAVMDKTALPLSGSWFVENTPLYIAPVGTERSIDWKTSGSMRWQLYAGTLAESGSDAGSNFNLGRFHDTGVFIDNPLLINRATGQVNLNSPGGLSVTGPAAFAGATTVGGALTVTGVATLNGALTSGPLTATTSVTVNGPQATARGLFLQTNGVARWNLFENTVAEAGSATGSDLVLNRFDNTGAYLGDALVVTRSTGNILLNSTGGGQTTVNNGQLNVNGAAATTRALDFQTGGVLRWHLQVDASAETGGNTGSNL